MVSPKALGGAGGAHRNLTGASRTRAFSRLPSLLIRLSSRRDRRPPAMGQQRMVFLMSSQATPAAMGTWSRPAWQVCALAEIVEIRGSMKLFMFRTPCSSISGLLRDGAEAYPRIPYHNQDICQVSSVPSSYYKTKTTFLRRFLFLEKINLFKFNFSSSFFDSFLESVSFVFLKTSFHINRSAIYHVFCFFKTKS